MTTLTDKITEILGNAPSQAEIDEAFPQVTSKLARIIKREGSSKLTDGYITQVYADEIRQNRAEKKCAGTKAPSAQSPQHIIIDININVKAKQ